MVEMLVLMALSPVLTYFMLRKAHQEELARLMYVFERSMLLSHPGASLEKVQAESVKQSADLQLKILEDALEQEKVQKARQEKNMNPTPKYVNGFDAQGNQIEVDMNDYEIVD